MKYFQLRENQNIRTSWIDASHKWGLSGVDCPSCNSIWGTVGLEFPSIDLSEFVFEPEYREARCLELRDFIQMRNKIADAFPELSLLAPGATFGPLTGKANSKKIAGFVWRAWWTICLEESALEMLQNSGLKLPRSVKCELTSKIVLPDVYELDLPLEGRLVNPVYDGIQLDHCSACGRDSGSLPDEPLIDVSSVSGQFDIFRIRNFTTLILVSERFAETVDQLGIKGASFENAKVFGGH